MSVRPRGADSTLKRDLDTTELTEDTEGKLLMKKKTSVVSVSSVVNLRLLAFDKDPIGLTLVMGRASRPAVRFEPLAQQDILGPRQQPLLNPSPPTYRPRRTVFHAVSNSQAQSPLPAWQNCLCPRNRDKFRRQA
jgi:hypothetical protein